MGISGRGVKIGLDNAEGQKWSVTLYMIGRGSDTSSEGASAWAIIRQAIFSTIEEFI